MSYSEIVQVLRDLLTPIFRAHIYDALIDAFGEFFVSDLDPYKHPTLFRIGVTFSTSGVFKLVRRIDQSTIIEEFNSGNALLSNCSYIFDTIVEKPETINFVYTTSTTILHCTVIEIPMVS